MKGTKRGTEVLVLIVMMICALGAKCDKEISEEGVASYAAAIAAALLALETTDWDKKMTQEECEVWNAALARALDAARQHIGDEEVKLDWEIWQPVAEAAAARGCKFLPPGNEEIAAAG